jgi:hypothetical protein
VSRPTVAQPPIAMAIAQTATILLDITPPIETDQAAQSILASRPGK